MSNLYDVGLNWAARCIASVATVAVLSLASAGLDAELLLLTAGCLALVASGGLLFDLVVGWVDRVANFVSVVALNLAGALLFLGPGAYGATVLVQAGHHTAAAACAVAAIVLALVFVGVIAVLRRRVPFSVLAFAANSVLLVAVTLTAHVLEETLLDLPEDSATVRFVVFGATVLASAGLALLWQLRTTATWYKMRSPHRWLGALLAGATAATLLLTDANLFHGRYEWFHWWLLVVGMLTLDLALTLALTGLTARITRPLGIVSVATLPILIAALYLTPALQDMVVRTQLDETLYGPRILRQIPLVRSQLTADSHPLLTYDRQHDVATPKNDFNILLFTIDTLRADYVGADSENGEHAPTMAKLIESSTYFTHVYAPSTHTAASMGSFLTGKYSANLEWELWIRKGRQLHDPDALTDEVRAKIGTKHQYTTVPAHPEQGTIAERVQDAGYYTMATPYLAHAPFFRRGVGYEHGFDRYKDYGARVKKVPASSKIVADALAQIDRAKGKRWFQWTHVFDPHAGQAKDARYSTMVEHTDAALAELIDGLKARNLWDTTVLVITADHGEAMGEHGKHFHGLSVYEEEARVPLIIRVPGAPARRLDEPASTLDAAATIVALAGGEMDNLDGVNLAPFIYDGQYPKNRPVFIELHRYLKRETSPRYDQKAIVLGDDKLIYDRNGETLKLFDLDEDPEEQTNVAAEQPERTRELFTALNAFVQRGKELPGVTLLGEVD